MNSQKLEEIVTCGVCFEFFNENSRCPRVLSCGHTFCHTCLDKLLVQSPTCPTCKCEIHSHTAESIPVNFSVKNMISLTSHDNILSDAHGDLPEKSLGTSSGKFESEGFCMEHSSYKELRCMDCESWICAMCGMLLHKGCRTLLVKDSYKELKEQVSQKVGKELKIMNDIDLKILRSLETFEEEERKLSDSLSECKNRIDKFQLLKSENGELCENLGRLQTAAENSTNDSEFSKAINELEELVIRVKKFVSQFESFDVLKTFPSSFEGLRKLCEEQSVFVVENKNEKILYGMVTVNEGQIWISSFQSEKPSGQLFPFKKLLQKFTASTDLPSKVFFKLTTRDRRCLEVDLVIKTNEMSPRVENFIFLCSALKGDSYKGRILTIDGLGFYQLSSVPVSVVEGIEVDDRDTYMEVGDVVGFESDSGFYIRRRRGNDSFFQGYPFGNIIFGLEKLRNINADSLVINDCGLVI